MINCLRTSMIPMIHVQICNRLKSILNQNVLKIEPRITEGRRVRNVPQNKVKILFPRRKKKVQKNKGKRAANVMDLITSHQRNMGKLLFNLGANVDVERHQMKWWFSRDLKCTQMNIFLKRS